MRETTNVFRLCWEV